MLDFTSLVPQIAALAEEHIRRGADATVERQLALDTLERTAVDWREGARRIRDSHTSWLPADWVERPDAVYPLPSVPASYAVLATDGSQIMPDRHQPVFCYLLNVGMVALRYGDGAQATLTSEARVSCADPELLDDTSGQNGRRIAIERMAFELDALGRLIREAAETGVPAVALVDAPLALWWLESSPDAVQREAVGHLLRLFDVAREARVPVAGYVSEPGSREAVTSLRIQRCIHPRADCDRFCPQHAEARFKSAPCAGTESMTDAMLMRHRLQSGERSALFGSRSKIVKQYREENAIQAFYLYTGAEIARVELPRWAAEDAVLLSRLHALAYDQAQKGQGYPRALTEAHEKAVVRGADRALFYQLVERELARHHAPISTSRKEFAKRTRSV